MKTLKQQAINCLAVVSVLFPILGALAQSGPPPPPPDPFLQSYSFADTNWLSDLGGYPPIAFTDLVSVPLLDGNALQLDTGNSVPAFLEESVVDSGHTNVILADGAVGCIFINDWATADTNQLGAGPGDTAFLLASGDFSTGSPQGLWAIWADAAGQNLIFGGVSNSLTVTYASAPISWPANSIHLLAICYGDTNTTMFLDGQLAATGGPVTIIPPANSFFIGSDAQGYEQMQAIFYYLEFDTSAALAEFGPGYFTNQWVSLSNQFAPLQASPGSPADTGPPAPPGGSGTNGSGSNGPPYMISNPTYSVTTNYQNYSNFWMTVTLANTNTAAAVSLNSTLRSLTYIIETNSSLASPSGWGAWQRLVASNSVTPAPLLSLVSNAPLFFRASLVWSTCTNYATPLPDWWAMLYFNSTACVNPAGNPAGDGIDNWDKYLLGLNPNVAYVSPLLITPPGGNFVSTPSITVFSIAGDSIKYTTNGSLPSATNGMTVSSGVPLTNLPSGSFTLKAWESGLVSNVPAVATYTIIPAAPSFSLPEGLYAGNTALQITCATTNAVVRYTTNGIDPATNSLQIHPTNVLTLTTNVTIKATAWLGTNASPVAAATYLVQIPSLPPPPPPNDNFSNAITLSGASGQVQGTTAGATVEAFEINNPYDYFYLAVEANNSVWYKWTAPSNGSVLFDYFTNSIELGFYYYPSNTFPNPTNLVPAGSFQLPVGFIQNADGISQTLSVTQNVTCFIAVPSLYQGPFNLVWQYAGPDLTTPVFGPPGGNYYAGQTVTISCADPDAIIHYTLDDANPTTNDPVIVPGGSLTLYQTTTLKAATWRLGLTESSVITALYTIQTATTNAELAGAPVLSPTNCIFTNSLTVTLTCTNARAIIYYTLDGTTPTTASPSVSSGGMATFTNSAILNALAWASNLNLSPITTGQYAKWGVDTAGDGIPDSGKLQIGADILIADAGDVNPNSFAHGLNNMQVYQNQSVLLADNYSTLNDGIPDWWLVKNGYSLTTAATALGANGQTLLASYLAGLNPTNPNSQPGQSPPIDFHIVHGPANSLIMVLDTVRPGMAGYLFTCINTDAGLPGIIEEFPANQSMDQPTQSLGRYFQLTNSVPPGYWLFTLQGVNSNGILSQISSNTFTSYQEVNDFDTMFGTIGGPAESSSQWARYVGVPIPVVGYTNKNTLKQPLLTQMLRAESDSWQYFLTPFEGALDGFTGPLIYDDQLPQSLVTESYWGTWTFQFDGYWDFPAINFASYFTPICATGDVATDCDDYTNFLANNFGAPFPTTDLTPLQVVRDNNMNPYFAMPDDSWGAAYRFNPAGLEYLSVIYRITNQAPITLYPGQSSAITNTNFIFEAALQTETPSIQTLNYFFDGRQYPVQSESGYCQRSCPPIAAPDQIGFDGWMEIGLFDLDLDPVSITNPVIIVQVGRTAHLQAWSQVVAVRPNPNGQAITNLPYWIDQDFAQAYLCNPATGDVPRTSQPNLNGKMMIDTNAAVSTGILSPNLNYTNSYLNDTLFGQRGADFTPTQPGKVIVTTLPDANGNYGEVTIYALDMQVDANHDGVMDNRDLTSLNNPMQFWVNNDVDRWHTVDVTDSEQDDLQINDSSIPWYNQVPDCFFGGTNGPFAGVIPCTRDLEDYARLWIPGLSNLMQVLPTNYTVTLQWRNNTGAGIRAFAAADADGGTNYLFNSTIASNQVNYVQYPCLGYANPNQTISMNAAFAYPYAPPPSDHFIFCGTSAGNDELVLQVKNPWGGVAGEASVFLNLKDIKQMYERWSVGENPNVAPNTIATNCGDDGSASFQYPYDPSIDSATPYILLVHGYNMPTWEKDRYAETAYKRLYWQGYQGRFGLFRWPTHSTPILFDSDEWNSWQSATGLKNLLVALNLQYTGNVYLLAHSLGNVAAGEALRLAGATEIVNTYVASQAAISAHAYDNTVHQDVSYTPATPDIEGHYYTNSAPPYFNGISGAGAFVDFFNPVDWALTGSTIARPTWLYDQSLKPDISYSWDGTHFWYYSTLLQFPTNTYQIFAMCAQSYSWALGAETNNPRTFFAPASVNLSVAPLNFGSAHKGHSGQFRSDNMSRAVYWNQLLQAFDLNPESAH